MVLHQLLLVELIYHLQYQFDIFQTIGIMYSIDMIR